MEVRIIGSGSMWSKYNSAAYLIDKDILVDMPNGMCKNMLRFGLNAQEVKHVLLTHFHGDHYFDMPFYLLLKSRASNKSVNIYCSKEGVKKIRQLLKLAFPNSDKAVLQEINLHYNHDAHFKINNYEVEKLLVDHGRMKPAYGYVFKEEDKKIGFTGDTTYCAQVEYLASICDYLFCDCMFLESTDKHMGLNDLQKLALKYPNCHFVTSHMEEQTWNKIKELDVTNITCGEDNQEFII